MKVYLCCRIITHYRLDVNPLDAAFDSELPADALPEGFRLSEGDDLETAVAEMLGIDDQA